MDAFPGVKQRPRGVAVGEVVEAAEPFCGLPEQAFVKEVSPCSRNWAQAFS
jgi:hypothetical protein